MILTAAVIMGSATSMKQEQNFKYGTKASVYPSKEVTLAYIKTTNIWE
jgi:hypothetical protein